MTVAEWQEVLQATVHEAEHSTPAAMEFLEAIATFLAATGVFKDAIRTAVDA